MFKQFFDVFWPKVKDYVAEQGLNNVTNMKDFEHNLETLRKNLKLLSGQACDVQEEIKNGERSGRKKRKREVEEWLEDVRSIGTEVDVLGSQVESQGFIVMRLMDGGGKAAELNMHVEKLLQQRLDFGEPLLDARGTREDILLANGMVGDAFSENLETILKLLENRQVSKIGVYGMGGIGKTMLTKQIYNKLVKQSQRRMRWITVSQEFTIRSLQDKIARSLGVDLSDEDEEAIRAGKLNRFLSQMKNWVLILDDVWEKIDMLKVGCTFSVEFCRLIITTRSVKVCRQIGCEKLIPVVKLRRDEAWMLFHQTLGNEAELGPQVEEIAKSMTALCSGLPLGIITVAGSMKGETAIHRWQNALAELKECVRGQDEIGEVEEVFKVLKYSFDRLKRSDERERNEPNMIQQCFLYCSLYHEDYVVGRGNLVRSFISEGFVDGRRSRRAQVEQGHSILDKLVNFCLLESCIGDDNRECVKMHDLVRSMALRICKGKYLVRAGEDSLKEISDQEEWTEDLEKVSFMRCRNIVCIEEGFSPDCPKLSTLLLWENFRLSSIPESFFSKMQGLCILDLSWNSQIATLPNSVSDLTSLKSLLLEGCFKLEKVPYLEKLKALRELNLTCSSVKEVPQGLDELLNLRFLPVATFGLKLFPKGLLLKLGHLEHLNLAPSMEVEIEEIENLKRLEEFGAGVKSVSDFNRFISTRRVHDLCYRVGVNSNDVSTLGFEYGGDLRGNNNELVLCMINLKDEKVLGKGIGYLSINRCEGMSKWFMDDLSEKFDNPTSLKRLTIFGCSGIEWIARSDDGEGLSNTTLEEIRLHALYDLKGVVMERAAAQPPVFSSLKRLNIFGSDKMRKMGLPSSGLPNLEYIRLARVEKYKRYSNKKKVKGEGERTVVDSVLPKLKELRLFYLRRLKRVSKAKIICNSIQTIDITECPRLMKKLPLHFDDDLHPPPSLKAIKVKREWWESLDWDINPHLPKLLQPFVRFRISRSLLL